MKLILQNPTWQFQTEVYNEMSEYLSQIFNWSNPRIKLAILTVFQVLLEKLPAEYEIIKGNLVLKWSTFIWISTNNLRKFSILLR